MTKLARVVMQIPFVRRTVAEQTATIAGGRTLHTWDDLLTQFPETIGVKTGHTGLAGWCQVAAARVNGVTVYATLLGSPGRRSETTISSRCSSGGCRGSGVVPRRAAEPHLRVGDVGYGKAPLGLVAARPLLRRRERRQAAHGDGGRATGVSLPVRQGAVLGRVEIRSGSRLLGTRDLVASRTINKPGVGGRLRWYAGRTLAPPDAPSVTSDLDDRHRHTQRRDRPHPDRAELPARAAPSRERRRRRWPAARASTSRATLKALGVPVVATGLVGGTTGTRIVEELTSEAILNDFVRIDGESRTSTAVVDPAGGTYTEINEWGPAVVGRGARDAAREAALPDPGRGARRLRRLAAPRRRRRLLRRSDARARAARTCRSCSTPRASRCGSGVEAEPFLVSPNQAEAEALVGQEFHDDEDFLLALDRIAEMGARNVLITTESGCVALLREEREARRFRAVAPRLEPVSTVGAGDVLLGAFLAARHAGRTNSEALRAAVATGAASTLEVGAGRFDPRQAGRLQAGVDVSELEPVEA